MVLADLESSNGERVRQEVRAQDEPTLNLHHICFSGSRRMAHDDSFLPFGSPQDSDSESPPDDDLPPGLRQAGRDAYRRGWTEYRKADCPFGLEDKAMLVWFSFSRGSAQNAITVSKN